MNNDSIMSFPGIDGFNDGDVYEIYVDPDNQVWISTVKKGVYRFDGTEFHHYSVPVSVMSMIMDQSGNLWMGAAGGLYCITSEGEVVNVNQDGPWDF